MDVVKTPSESKQVRTKKALPSFKRGAKTLVVAESVVPPAPIASVADEQVTAEPVEPEEPEETSTESGEQPRATIRRRMTVVATEPEPEPEPKVAAEVAEEPVTEAFPEKTTRAIVRRTIRRGATKTYVPVADRPRSDIWSTPAAIEDFATEFAPRYEVLPDTFFPINRFGFAAATTKTFAAFTLPRKTKANPERCADLLAPSKEVKRFLYQRFVRDFMQSHSPYRGILVYHGLGSGKTCTSVGVAEAIFATEHRHIIVMTPRSLRANFRNDLKKCGSTAYSTDHNWLWLDVAPDTAARDPSLVFLTDTIGIPEKLVKRNTGGWYFNPLPDSKPNFAELGKDQQQAIEEQIEAIIDNRYTFISYNGLQRKSINIELCEMVNMPPLKPGGPQRRLWRNKFDGAVVIIDEIHNFVGKIQNVLESVMREEDVVPRDDALLPACRGDGAFAEKGYPIGYILYHWLTTARDCRIIGLSATPIINHSAELAILTNMLHGNTELTRFAVRISPEKGLSMPKLQARLASHPLVDYLAVRPSGTEAGIALVEVTRCPDRRIMRRDAKGHLIGLVPDTQDPTGPRNPTVNTAAFANYMRKFVEAGGYELPPMRDTVKLVHSYSLLPALRADFAERYVASDMTGLVRTEQLKRRLSGLISFYRGSDLDLMPRAPEQPIRVVLPMSEYQAAVYADVRGKEMEKERTASKNKGKTAKKGKAGEEATEDIASSYKIYSRAACNFVFPEEIERPRPSGRVRATDVDLDVAPEEDGFEAGTQLGNTGIGAAEEFVAPAPSVAGPKAAKSAKSTDDGSSGMAPKDEYAARVVKSLEDLWETKHQHLLLMPPDAKGKAQGLERLSPKFAAIVKRIGETNGSSLVYSQFKSMEGLTILGMAMSANGYATLRLKRTGFVPGTEGTDAPIPLWHIDYRDPKTDPAKPKFILYSGDIDEKERELLRLIFNGQWAKLPETLREAIEADATAQRLALGAKEAEKGVNPNLRGNVVRAFMITSAGAEGISLRNVRSVHMVEPYWNNVRLEQVQGRASRLCSHMDLPEADRVIEVFVYLVSFTKDQLSLYSTLATMDNKQTTDQNVYDIAQRKLVIANAIAKTMQEAAVDCALNSNENGKISCSVRDGDPERYLYTPKIEEDDHIDDRNVVRKKYRVDPKTQQVYDEAGKLIGTLVDGKVVPLGTGAPVVHAPSVARKSPSNATTPKATTPKATTPKATTPKATTPKATTPKATTPKATTPKATTPKSASKKASPPKSTNASVKRKRKVVASRNMRNMRNRRRNMTF